MTEELFENIKSDVLPYDFVKDNEVIALNTENGFIVSSPKQLSKEIYNEIQRYLNSSLNYVNLKNLMKFSQIHSLSPIMTAIYQKSFLMSLIYRILLEVLMLQRIF